MPTIDKTGKPTILTESDQVLLDLKSELAQLKSRMSSIEQEQEQNRILVEKLSFQEELANEAISSHHKEVKANRENYQVIASVMNNLKSPVNSVVSNLSGVIAEIDDSETKKTLEACVNTASNVLHSFDDVEDFCLSASTEKKTKQRTVNVRDYFRDILSDFQSSKEYNSMEFKLLVDKQVPENSNLHSDTIKECLAYLFSEVHHIDEQAKTTICVRPEKHEEKYGFDITDLSLTIEWEGSSSQIEWQDSWLKSIQLNHSNLINSGFNLLKTRDIVRKTGGHMTILQQEKRMTGFKINIPMTY